MTSLPLQARKKTRNEKKRVHLLVSPLTLYDFRLTVVKGRRNKKMGIQIGEKAPDFKAEAYYRGKIQEIQLSHYQGQWVVLLYPADFTFV